jgi:CBS domain containing-hemolysin-like protein
MNSAIIPYVIIALLIFFNGVFVAAEFAIIAVPPTRITQLARSGSRPAQMIQAILRNPDQQNRYLATAQIGITVVSLGLGMYGEEVLAEILIRPLEHYGAFGEAMAHTISAVIAVSLLTYLHVVLGEMVAKSLALQFSETAALRLIGPMMTMQNILRPAIAVLNGLGSGVTRLLGVPPMDVSSRLFSPTELEFIVDESYEQGLLDESEQLFIENILDLRERTVGQVMTPRTRVVGIPLDADEEATVKTVCEVGHSRYPIYEEDMDHIVGVLHVKDLVRYRIRHRSGEAAAFDLAELANIRPITFVPETLPVEIMLARFRHERLTLAIVIDEFGGTAGIVTLEDLVEEVVGEIQDEFDREVAPIEELGPGELRVAGSLLLDELNQHYDLNLSLPAVDTVGGLIMALLGRIPRPGDTVETEGVTFQVERVRGRAVDSVRVYFPDHGLVHKQDDRDISTDDA